jgi:hypothetical protein
VIPSSAVATPGTIDEISIDASSDPLGGDPSGTVSLATEVVVHGTPVLLTFVNIKGDTDPEAKEQFTVHLHGTSHAVLANNTKRYRIVNDD